MYEILILSLKNLSRHKIRSFFCILAVFFAIFFIILANSFLNGMANTQIASIRIYDMGDIKITTKEFDKKKKFLPLYYPIESVNTLIEELKTIDNIKVFPRIEAYATLTDNIERDAVLWGINFEEETLLNHFNFKNKSNGLKEGRLPEINRNECMIGYRLAAKMKVNIGDVIPIKIVSSQFSDKFLAPKIVGIFDMDFPRYDLHYIIMDFKKLQKIATLSGRTQSIVIFLNKKEKEKNKKLYEVTKIASQYNLLTSPLISSPALSDVREYNVTSAILNLIFIILASFLIFNTISMVVFERVKEIGIFSSMGMNNYEIIALFFLEGIILGLVGIVLGLSLGGSLTYILSQFPISLEKVIGSDIPFSTTLFIGFSFLTLLNSALLGIAVVLLSTLIPALKTSRVDIIEILRD